MKVKKIIPCICTGREPNSSDSVHFGMPILKVWCSSSGNLFWSVECPNCGRGGITEYSSQYYALLSWNKMQERLRNIDIFSI